MILVCPSCDTRYFAEDSAIGKEGRRVRCASCGHSWHARTPDEAQAPAEDTGLTREQVERLRQTAAANSASRSGPHAEFRAREHKRRQRARLHAAGVAWLAGFVLFAGAAGAAVMFRHEVAEAWPRSASLYRAVGLEVNPFGLELADVAAKRSFDGTTPVLTVTGTVANQGPAARTAPQLRVTLRDEGGAEVQTWTEPMGVDRLAAGETRGFTLRLEAPPVETYRLTVTFAREQGGAHAGGEVEAATDSGHPAPEGLAPEGTAAAHENVDDAAASDAAGAGGVEAPAAAHEDAHASNAPAGESDHH